MSLTALLSLQGALALPNLIPGLAQDAVAIFDSNFNQLFQEARPLRVRTLPRAKVMDHTLETGQIVSDYKVVLPVEIVIPLMISAQFYRSVYQQIWQAWQTSELLVVQTRVASYGNMIISEMPDEETPEQFTTVTVELHLRQFQLVQQQPQFAPANPAMNSTQPLGQQSSYAITPVETQAGTIGFSSVPPNPGSLQITGVQTMNGVQTIPLAGPSIPLNGVQSVTPEAAVAASFF